MCGNVCCVFQMYQVMLIHFVRIKSKRIECNHCRVSLVSWMTYDVPLEFSCKSRELVTAYEISFRYVFAVHGNECLQIGKRKIINLRYEAHHITRIKSYWNMFLIYN